MRILNRQELYNDFPNQPELRDRNNRFFFVDAIEGIKPFNNKTDLRFFLLCRNIRLDILQNMEINYESHRS